ncbi:sugar transferase [Labrys miyagiensis]|uniref:sugar transferase n=1 Tax=Labrys miyagiensis TaxID=346912 RepID=UPI0024E0E04E|nr:sugar transferase [Labrys miyagiensis]
MAIEPVGVNSDAGIAGARGESRGNGNINRTLPRKVAQLSKRGFDVAVSSAALIFLLPLIAAMAGALLILQGRPLFIRHNRVGLGGKSFPCLKFRSMVVNADLTLRAHLRDNEAARQEWEETHKLKNDPRITPIGRFLRKSSVDELPQLINIILGDMSLVGPRPIVRDEIVRYGLHIEDYKRVRPGLTGLWQISGRNDTSYHDRVALDVRYVREWSFWRDLSIIAKTVPAVLKSSGSY